MNTLVRLARWGDDFSLTGRRSLGNTFRDDSVKAPAGQDDSCAGPEAIHLNRLLRLCPPGAEGGERWELEADPRHVEVLVSQMGLGDESKAVSILGEMLTCSLGRVRREVDCRNEVPGTGDKLAMHRVSSVIDSSEREHLTPRRGQIYALLRSFFILFLVM